MFLFRWITAPLRLAVKLVLLLLAAVVVYYAATLVQVWLTSRRYDPVDAQAIVVMGAAQHDGVPSPDLRSRLGEALRLYHERHGHLFVCTGSMKPGPVATEAQSCMTYLTARGVPGPDVIEVGGRSSWTELARAADSLRRLGDTSVLIVTDPFREDRSMAIATEVGLTPHPAPAQASPIGGTSLALDFLKTAAVVAIGRIVGYKLLHEISDLAVVAASAHSQLMVAGEHVPAGTPFELGASRRWAARTSA